MVEYFPVFVPAAAVEDTVLFSLLSGWFKMIFD